MAAKKSSSTSSADTLLAQGRELHARGQLQAAFSHYQQALALQPEHPEALHLSGLAYLGLGQGMIGIALMRKAVALRPEDADFRLNLGRALAQAGQADEALAQLGKACELAPDDAAAHAALAALHARLEQLPEAERHYARAAGLAPQQGQLHHALSLMRYHLDRLPEAVQSHRQAMQLAPELARTQSIGFALAGEPLRDPEPAWMKLRTADAFQSGDGPARLQAACTERDLVVVDDFIDDPAAYRSQAMALTYQGGLGQPADGNFPGAQTPGQPCQPLMDRIARAVGRDIKWISPDNGAVRISVAADSARCDIHVDSQTQQNIFAALLYLSPPEHCRGGTSFWRHRETGFDRLPQPGQLQAAGYKDFAAFQRRWTPVDRTRPFAEFLAQRERDWEWLFEVPMRFNRLVVYRSDFFHSISELFGDSRENGRMVQLFYFEALNPAA
jgi:tetratricopeptide (TPR) repeat protein